MSYANGRVIHDADSHTLEDPEFFRPYASEALWDRMPPLYGDESAMGANAFHASAARQQDPEFRARAAEEVMQRKLWDAPGAWLKADRSAALDAMGFASQIVYDSFLRLPLRVAEQGDDVDFVYDMAWCHVQGMLDFGSDDPRLIPAGYVPFADPPRTVELARRALEAGCRVVTLTADCPRDHSPAHEELEPFWALMAEARVPVIYHLGGGRLPSPAFKHTGRREDVGFVGGDGTFNSLEWVGAHIPVLETLGALVIDGVLARHPDLRIGVVEYGAMWVPGFMKLLDAAQHAYRRTEERFGQLEMRPSEYVARQVRVTPFHFEDVAWLMDQAGPEMFLFSSDFPHKEGGRDPIGKFDANFDAHGVSAADRDLFYSGNMEEMLGARIAA